MGFKALRRNREKTAANPTDTASVNERYAAYFPRLYTYVRSCVGGEMPAQDIAVEAFARAFSRAGDSDEDRFRTVLFRVARRLCRPILRDNTSGDSDSLNAREREVISLVFDAGLTRSQIARLFRIRETTVGALLMNGLRKLKEQASPAAVSAYLKMA
jgi:DNA-directed RNA polymerase specialized sigma24 family protein